MDRFAFRPVVLTLVTLGTLLSGAQAWPSPSPELAAPGGLPFQAHGFGVIDPGACTAVPREIIDNSNRVHKRLDKVCR